MASGLPHRTPDGRRHSQEAAQVLGRVKGWAMLHNKLQPLSNLHQDKVALTVNVTLSQGQSDRDNREVLLGYKVTAATAAAVTVLLHHLKWLWAPHLMLPVMVHCTLGRHQKLCMMSSVDGDLKQGL